MRALSNQLSVSVNRTLVGIPTLSDSPRRVLAHQGIWEFISEEMNSSCLKLLPSCSCRAGQLLHDPQKESSLGAERLFVFTVFPRVKRGWW